MFKTQYAKVVNSTYNSNTETKEMIGGIYEVMRIDYYDKEICLWNKNKEDYWWLNFSDVLPATEEEYRNQFKAQFEKKNECNCSYHKNKEIEELEFSHNNNDILKKVNELVRAVNKLSK